MPEPAAVSAATTARAQAAPLTAGHGGPRATRPVTGVLGQGAVGRAVSARLAHRGFTVHAADRDGRHRVLAARPEVLVLALTRGEECLAQLAEAAELPPVVIDLTTQAPDSAARCTRLATARGAAYHGGGLTGSPRALATGGAVLLLGPAPAPETPAGQIVAALGRVIGFPEPRAGALAKLLHNWVLVVQQWAAALALRCAGEDIDPAVLVAVLEAGTAGRPVAQWSVVRDAAGPATSTYLSRLVAKDLDELARAVPRLADEAGPLLGLLRAVLPGDGEQPFTEALLADASPAETKGTN